MGQSRPLFVYFRPFLITISIQIEKSVDGVLGIRTRGRRMVDADETTELWQPPWFAEPLLFQKYSDHIDAKFGTRLLYCIIIQPEKWRVPNLLKGFVLS